MKTHLLSIIMRVAGLCLLLMQLSCSQTPFLPEKNSELSQPLKQALLYYESREPVKAEELIKSYLRKVKLAPDQRNAAYRLLGSIYFSTQQYRQARDQFMQAKLIDIHDYTSVHRYWSSALLADDSESTRSRIRSEIENIVSNPATAPNMLLAAYNGYGYLRDREGTKNILLKLIAASPTVAVNDTLPYLLMEEMLSIRSVAEALTYGHVFMSRFANHVNFPVVVNSLFNQALRSKDIARIISEFMPDNQYNPYLEYQIARFHMTRELDYTQAFKRLDALLTRIETDQLPHCAEDANLPICKYFLNKLVAEAFQLQALLLAQQGQLKKAVRYATKASQSFSESATIWTDLANLLMENDRLADSSRALLTALNLKPDLKSSQALFFKQNSMKATSLENAKQLSAQQQQIPFFENVTDKVGLGNVKARRIAWGDVNNDGYDDLLFDGAMLFINKQGQGFENVTKKAAFISPKGASGGLFIDYDNDGQLDILSTGKSAQLFKNNGDIQFEKIFDLTSTPSMRIAAASWGDYNNDGFADLYLANYEKPVTERAICDHDNLFINQKGKNFNDVSQLVIEGDPYRVCSRGVLWSDVNNDGKQEIIVSSYRQHPNKLLYQNTEKKLTNIAYASKFQGLINGHSIAAVSADFNGDGNVDIYQSNLAHPRYIQFSDTSHLYLGTGNSETIQFAVANNSGISFNETNADITSADFDNDGDLDLFITSIYPGRFSSLYLNDGSAHFTNASWLSNTQVSNGWGTASADFDNDGDTDLLVASRDGVRLLQNQSVNHRSFKVSVNSKTCQRNGIGMKLWLSYGGMTQFREIQAGKGTGTQDSASIIFGLGQYKGPLSLHVRDICGHDYHWLGESDESHITIY